MNPFERLSAILDRLDSSRTHYSLTRTRPDTVMVEVSIPGYRWEIEFFADGTVEAERFQSQGVDALDDRQIEELLQSWEDD